MGYCIELEDHNFVIKKEHAEDVLSALQHFIKYNDAKWISRDALLKTQNIFDAFDEIRYPLEIMKNGDYTIHYFSGEKIGDDEKIFNSIAEFVEPGSYIKFIGEDGAKFTYKFNGEECIEDWEEDEESTNEILLFKVTAREDDLNYCGMIHYIRAKSIDDSIKKISALYPKCYHIQSEQVNMDVIDFILLKITELESKK